MWERIIYESQLEAVQENTQLLQLPPMLQVPDTLENNNIGTIYRVLKVGIDSFNIEIINPVNPQEVLEAIYPAQISMRAILNNRWYFYTH